jgi:hypothetical protein
MNSIKTTFKKIITESFLIIISVLFAVILEGMWQQRQRRIEAGLLLNQLKNELSEDLSDLNGIIQNQRQKNEYYLLLLRELQSLNRESFYLLDSSLNKIGSDNRTLYPRTSSWSVLISSGLLTAVGEKDLSVKLMSFFEKENKRILDNGDGYDRTLNEMLRIHIPTFWDYVEKKPLSTDHQTISKFRSQMVHVHKEWNLYYIELLEQHKVNIENLIKLIELRNK